MTLTLTPALTLAAIVLVIPAAGAIGYELGQADYTDNTEAES